MHPMRRVAGMTLLELVAAVVVITLVLGVLVGVSDALVNDSAQRQTLATLRTLNRCIEVFHQAHGEYPGLGEPRHIKTAMGRCIADLRSSPTTGSLVADLPGLTYGADGWFTVVDGFGQPLLYVDPNAADPDAAATVKRFQTSPNLRPFVVSAGPDGQFGNLDSNDPQQRTLSADNLYSFDLESSK